MFIATIQNAKHIFSCVKNKFALQFKKKFKGHNNMDITISKLTASSTNEIFTIAKWFDSWQEWPKPTWALDKICKKLSARSKKGSFPAIFVAKVGKEVVATVSLGRFDDTKKSPEYYPWIMDAYVAIPYRKQGIFRQMLCYVCDYLKSLGYSKVYIRTDHTSLYEKLGFTYSKDIVIDDGRVERLYEKKL